VIPTIAPFLLPRVLPGLQRAYPHLELMIQEEMSHVACEALSRGRRDCLILALPYPCGDLEYAVLFEDPILVAVNAREPLAAQASIAPQELPADRLLLLDDGHCLRDHVLSACDRADLDPRAMRGASIHTLVQLVHAGLGVSLIPAMAVEAGVTAGTSVTVRPLAAPSARRTIALAWRRNSPRAEEFVLLAEALRRFYVPDASAGEPPHRPLCGLGAAERALSLALS
jgi:LysR family hydrogen peroxide-inducible transcriptional activator